MPAWRLFMVTSLLLGAPSFCSLCCCRGLATGSIAVWAWLSPHEREPPMDVAGLCTSAKKRTICRAKALCIYQPLGHSPVEAVRPVAVILAQFPGGASCSPGAWLRSALEVQIKDSSFKQASHRATTPCAGAAMREPGPGAGAAPGMLLNMPSLQSTLQTPAVRACPGGSGRPGCPAACGQEPLAGHLGRHSRIPARCGRPGGSSGFHSGSWVGAPPDVSSSKAVLIHVCNNWPFLLCCSSCCCSYSCLPSFRHDCCASLKGCSSGATCTFYHVSRAVHHLPEGWLFTLQTPDNSMATSSHPPISASIVASVTPQSTSPTGTSSEHGSDSGHGAGATAGAASSRRQDSCTRGNYTHMRPKSQSHTDSMMPSQVFGVRVPSMHVDTSFYMFNSRFRGEF